MTTLTATRIAQWAARAGFKDRDSLAKAVAVALAESSGRTDAVNVNSDKWRSRDRGLWQINSHWHPEVTDAMAFDPGQCAAAAFKISNGGKNWSAWSTWKNGSAQLQLGRATIAATQVLQASQGGTGGGIPFTAGEVAGTDGTQGIPFTASDGPSAITPMGDGIDLGGLLGMVPGLSLITEPLQVSAGAFALALRGAGWIADPHNWQRVAMAIGGTAGVLLALGLIARSGAAGSTVQAAAKAPGKVAKAGAGAVLAVETGGASVAAKAGKAASAAKVAA